MSGQGAVRLTNAEVDALTSRVHQGRVECRHADLLPTPCEDWADHITPTVEAIVAARVASALAPVEALADEYQRLWDEAREAGANTYVPKNAAAEHIRAALTAAPVPPADETGPQAGAGGVGGGGL